MTGIFDELKKFVNENDEKSIVINVSDPKAEVTKAYLEYCAKTGTEFDRWDLEKILDKLY